VSLQLCWLFFGGGPILKIRSAEGGGKKGEKKGRRTREEEGGRRGGKEERKEAVSPLTFSLEFPRVLFVVTVW